MKEEIILRCQEYHCQRKNHSLGKLILNQSLNLRCERRNYLKGLITIIVLNFKIQLHRNLKNSVAKHTPS